MLGTLALALFCLALVAAARTLLLVLVEWRRGLVPGPRRRCITRAPSPRSAAACAPPPLRASPLRVRTSCSTGTHGATGAIGRTVRLCRCSKG